MEVKTHIPDIGKLEYKNSVKVETDEEGIEVDRHVITKISFEAMDLDPNALADVHRLMSVGCPVHVVIGSTQAVMKLAQKEPVFAET